MRNNRTSCACLTMCFLALSMTARPSGGVLGQEQVEPITAQELSEFLDMASPVLVDVRSELMYRAGHIPSSVNIPVERIDRETGAVLSEIVLGRRPVVVYCG